MFIARISKGRTVKEFVLGVILIPTLLSFVWMSVFGGSALHLQAHGIADIVGAVNDDVATAMFVMLEAFPLAEILSLIAVTLVVVFFITSSDSGSLVVDHLTSGGKLHSPTPQRVFWAVMEGVIAAVLLIGGGLTTLQTASVTTGLPFALVLLIGVYSLYVGFSQELYVEDAVERAVLHAKEDQRLHEVVSQVVNSEEEPATAPARTS
jgi:choline/glycine/proline betaine transport protein